MSLISRMQSLQTNFFNRFKIRRHEVPPPVLRKSRADLPYKKSELIVVAKSPVVKWPNSSHKFISHTFWAWTLLSSFIMYLHFTSLLEKSAENVFEKPNHSNIKLTNETTEMYSLGFRFLSLLCMAGVATFFGLRPSRTIREIIVHKPTKNVILGCNRFCGTVPIYYIFDGRESERIHKITDRKVHKVHTVDRKHSDIEVMHGEIKVPYGIRFNREAPNSITLPPELEVILKSNDLASVKSKLLIDILNELHKQKKEKYRGVIPQLQDTEKNSFQNNFTLFWNRVCAPVIFLSITSFMIWANADLFYKDHQKFVKEMKATKFGQGGIAYLNSLTLEKASTEASTQDEFD